MGEVLAGMVKRKSIEYRLKEDDQLCFIHIPKTAGTTFTSIIDAKFSEQDICPARVWSELTQIPREELAKYKLLRGHFYYYIYKFLPRKPVYITMLRNPIERVVSGYEFMRRCRPSRPEGIPTHEKALLMTLKEYVCDPTVPGIINAQTRHISLNLQRELPDFMHPDWQESAQENLERFAFVGLTERFQDSMALLAYTFGWNPLIEYQNLMVAPKKLRQEDLEPDVIEAIAERNQLDIGLYQFVEEMFDHRYNQMIQDLVKRYGNSGMTHPSPREVYDLLEKHYEHRYAEQNIPLTKSIIFSFREAMSGSGWHLQEGMERGDAFRWTGPGTLSFLDFPIQSGENLVIQFRVINAVAPDVLESLTLHVNHHPIDFITLHSDEVTTIFQGFIPKSALVTDQSFTRLVFQVNRTASPQSIDPNNPDHRPVGLAFNLVQVFPPDSVEENSAVAFLFDCRAWQETVDFVQKNIQPHQQVLAPTIFSLKFPDNIPHQDPNLARKTQNYNLLLLESSNFQWAIIHKGMKQELGVILWKLMLQSFSPVMANEVFVIFAKDSDLPALSYTSLHVKPLYAGYIKYYFAQKTKLLRVLIGHLRVFAKQKVWPAYLVNVKPFYVKYFKKLSRNP
jgi:hypothetical protein